MDDPEAFWGISCFIGGVMLVFWLVFGTIIMRQSKRVGLSQDLRRNLRIRSWAISASLFGFSLLSLMAAIFSESDDEESMATTIALVFVFGAMAAIVWLMKRFAATLFPPNG